MASDSKQRELWRAVDSGDGKAVIAALDDGASPNIPLSPEDYFSHMDAMYPRVCI